MEGKAVLIYDSECNLCVRFKKALELIDLKSQVSFKSVYDQSLYITFPELNQEECEEVVHLVDSEGRIYRGPDVIEFLVSLVPGVSKFSWLLNSDSGKKAMDAFYGKINDIRTLKNKGCRTCGKKSKKMMGSK